MAKQRNKLERQCEFLNIPLDILEFPYIHGNWIFDGKSYKKPEHAALAHYESIGYIGTADECWTPMNIMCWASINALTDLAVENGRSGPHGYFYAQCSLYHDCEDRIAEAVRNAELPESKTAFSNIPHDLSPLKNDYYKKVMSIWKALGSDGWAKVARQVASRGYCYSAGWPDLTLASSDHLRFVEVKTTDSLGHNQGYVINNLLLPLGLSVSVLKIIPTNETRKQKPKPRKKTSLEMLKKRLKALRTENRFRLADIAESASITVEEYRAMEYEYGLYDVSLETIVLLADFYNVTLDYLLGRSDDPGENYRKNKKRRTTKEIVFKINCIGVPIKSVRSLKKMPLHQNLWVNSGSGSFPSV